MADGDPRDSLADQSIIELIDFVRKLADRCAEMCIDHLGQAREHRRKPDGSPVSALDLTLERRLREMILEAYPGHAILGEERGLVGNDPDYCWVLDPVDGTDDLVRGLPLFGFIIALKFRGHPVVAAIGHPLLGSCISAGYGLGAWHGERRIHFRDAAKRSHRAIAIPAFEDFASSNEAGERLFQALCSGFPNYRVYRNVYAHTAVITGALDAAVEYRVAEWDLSATGLAIDEAGGDYVEFDRYRDDQGVVRISAVFGERLVVREILELIGTSSGRRL